MVRGYDYKRYAVLYVDDEEQSLKYFRKAFDQDFRILTALSAAEARQILDAQGSEVGILITDQRMPGETGVDLLGYVRRTLPAPVRILTTAYSDLESAIEAVNTGAIFRYVVKPWDIRDLRGVLLRAMEFFLLQRERDLLLREKLSVLQRIIVADRVRCLAIMAAGLAHHIRNSMTALVTFLDLAPVKLSEELPGPERIKDTDFWEGMWSLAQRESQRLLQIVEDVVRLTIEPSYAFGDEVSISEMLEACAGEARTQCENEGGTFSVDIEEGLPHLKANSAMLNRFCKTVLRHMVKFSCPGSSISVSARGGAEVWGAPGVRVQITTDGPDWSEEEVASVFTVFAPGEDNPRDLGLELLASYFIVHHHGGDIFVHPKAPNGPGFEVLLPLDPQAVQRPPLEEDCLEKVFTRLDIWAEA